MTIYRASMDFFKQQKTAKTNTLLLLFLYILALVPVALMIFAICAGVIRLFFQDDSVRHMLEMASVMTAAMTAGAVYAGIAKMRGIARNGDSLARHLGGVRLAPHDAMSDAEHVLLHVVEEMAIASSVAVPSVYVLRRARGINAFAAGHDRNTAVIAVTQGCLNLLERDELQGMIAHEFSHILNGDMRLNLRLTGILGGITWFAILGGNLLTWGMGNSFDGNAFEWKHTRGRNNRGFNPIIVPGFLIFFAGAMGALCAEVIKAAASRQREFLADAAAVQFTRNPEGIANALRKIRNMDCGSEIASADAVVASHFYFANGLDAGAQSWPPIHPPLEERIQRLDPIGRLTLEDKPAPSAILVAQTDIELPPFVPSEQKVDLLAGGLLMTERQFLAQATSPQKENIDSAKMLLNSIPQELSVAAREPFSARAVIFGLLLNTDEQVRQLQIAKLEQTADKAVVAETNKIAPVIASLPRKQHIAVMQLASPALRNLSAPQFREFRDIVQYLIEADKTISVFEFMLQWSLMRGLSIQFSEVKPSKIRFKAVYEIEMECFALLSFLAWTGNSDTEQAQSALQAGAQELSIKDTWTLSPKERISMKDMDRVLTKLGDAAPELKRLILKACVAVVGTDGRLTIDEGELLRAVAEALGCPMPPIL